MRRPLGSAHRVHDWTDHRGLPTVPIEPAGAAVSARGGGVVARPACLWGGGVRAPHRPQLRRLRSLGRGVPAVDRHGDSPQERFQNDWYRASCASCRPHYAICPSYLPTSRGRVLGACTLRPSPRCPDPHLDTCQPHAQGWTVSLEPHWSELMCVAALTRSRSASS